MPLEQQGPVERPVKTHCKLNQN